MKTTYIVIFAVLCGAASIQLHSQSKPTESSGAILLQLKASNEALLIRQAATLEILKAMQVDSNQLRIVSKRG